jgi:hypothetical protein
MHKLRGRLTPSTLIAAATLIVAASGSSIAAGEIITTPDQLKDGVVTSQKIAPESVSNLRLKDPQLKLRVRGNGTSGPLGRGSAQHLAGRRAGHVRDEDNRPQHGEGIYDRT